MNQQGSLRYDCNIRVATGKISDSIAHMREEVMTKLNAHRGTTAHPADEGKLFPSLSCEAFANDSHDSVCFHMHCACRTDLDVRDIIC